MYYPVHKKEQYYTMYLILKDKGCTTCDKVWICREVRRIVQSRLECTNEQAEDVVLQTLAFDSLDEMCENTVSEGKDIFDKHEKHIYRLFIEKLGVFDDTEDTIGEQEMREVVNEVLNTLTDREQKVIRDRFGFDDGKEKTLEEVGADFGVTRERIRQIETKALKKLKQFSRIKQLESYI